MRDHSDAAIDEGRINDLFIVALATKQSFAKNADISCDSCYEQSTCRARFEAKSA
jgi:hypothetical protein